MTTVWSDDITIAYDDTGSGPPVVLVHGHPFDRSMWRPQVERLQGEGWRVIAPDLRGYGTSSVVPGVTAFETFARDIEALLNRLDVDQFVLCGLSMGGQIAMECHRLFGDRIRALVLAATSPHAETSEGAVARHDLADRLLREGMAAYADEVLTRMLTPDNIRMLPANARHVRRMMRDTPAEGAAAALRGRAERPDYVELLGRITVPVLVVVGAEDDFTPVDVARFMHERIPTSTLAVIDGAAHLPNLEREVRFNDHLVTFLRTLV